MKVERMFKIVFVKDVFEFNSEIICNLILISIEELIFNELKKFESQDFSNKFKFDDLKQVSFDEFISTKKFEEELKTIQKLIKRSCIFL